MNLIGIRTVTRSDHFISHGFKMKGEALGFYRFLGEIGNKYERRILFDLTKFVHRPMTRGVRFFCQDCPDCWVISWVENC